LLIGQVDLVQRVEVSEGSAYAVEPQFVEGH